MRRWTATYRRGPSNPNLIADTPREAVGQAELRGDLSTVVDPDGKLVWDARLGGWIIPEEQKDLSR